MSKIYEKYRSLYSNLIYRESHICFSKLPVGYTQFSDVVQEGDIVLMIILRKRLDLKRGKFITLLTTALKNRFQKLVREAYAKKRACLTVVDPAAFDIISIPESQQKVIERKEVLKKIRQVDNDIADLIENGVPEPLFIFARNAARAKAFRNQTKINKITFSEKIINAYYGKCLRQIILDAEKQNK